MLIWARDLLAGDINPVAVKELRQAVRSRFVNSIIVFFLLAMVIATGIFLFTTSMAGMMSPAAGSSSGATLFGVLVVVLGIGCLLIPGYAAKRLAGERIRSNPDLMFATALSAGRIVRGKFLANLALVVLLHSLCLPFMALSYLLRGIDLPSITLGLLMLLAGSAVLLMLGILMGSFPRTAKSRPAGRIGTFFAIIWFGPMLLSGMFSFSRARGGVFLGTGTAAAQTIATGAIGLFCLLALFYAFAVFVLSPPHANRHLALRGTFSAIWVIYGILCAAWIAASGANAVFGWLIVSLVLFVLMLLLSLSEGPVISARVRRAIPRRPVFRVAAFPYFSGPARGMAWSLLHIAVTLGISAAVLLWLGKDLDDWTKVAITATYAVCYCLTAALVNGILPGNSAVSAPWLIVLYFVAVGILLPGLLQEMYYRDKIGWSFSVEYANVFAMFKTSQEAFIYEHGVFCLVWLASAFLLGFPWFFRHVRDFAPPAEKA